MVEEIVERDSTQAGPARGARGTVERADSPAQPRTAATLAAREPGTGTGAARAERRTGAGAGTARADRGAGTGDVEIRPVQGRQQMSKFIKLPWRLYEGIDNWVPPLVSERRRHLDRKRNPFFEHAEAEYFLAYRDDIPVGRISAHIDRLFNSIHDNSWGMFGFYESIDDPQVTAALLDAAEKWLRARGRDRMVGPFDFSTNHEVGVLVEGHDLAPQILENWHHPYYRDLLESQGLTKAMDLYKWEIMSADHDAVLPVIYELADRLERDHQIKVRRMRKSNFAAELARFVEVYNASWERNWGFVPLTDREIDHMASELKPILDEDFAFVAEKVGGEVVGVSLSLPDFNHILAKVNGHLLPLGWLTALRNRRKIDEIRVFALGVKPGYHHTGVAAAFYVEVWRACLRKGIRRAETGWILEANKPMNRAMEALTGKIVKRYRVYERALSDQVDLAKLEQHAPAD